MLLKVEIVALIIFFYDRWIHLLAIVEVTTEKVIGFFFFATYYRKQTVIYRDWGNTTSPST